MTFEELDQILIHIDYYETFENNFLNKNYNEIDYGKRLGKKTFKTLFDAKDNYAYSNEINKIDFSEWNLILNNEESTDEELLITCLDIFDWGNVLPGNVKAAVDLYKNKKIKIYIKKIKKLLPNKSTISDEQSDSNYDDILWSSGWTKVYSFINNDILIYDSRVSAFLNHTLIRTDTKSEAFKKLTKHLYNFSGAQDRKRKVSKNYGFKNQHPKGIEGFNANLVSSWIIQLLNKKLDLNREIRDFERAFFMLGFDLNQIEN
jgi:hypothetical protein